MISVRAQRRLDVAGQLRDLAPVLGKHRELVVHRTHPFNAEPPRELLARALVTPDPLFYVRNHGTVPDIDAARYRLRVDGLVRREATLSLGELQSRHSRHTVTATLHCAGNRRLELTQVEAVPGEIAWREGAIGTARWTGVRLRDVLAATGIDERAGHVAFTGLDEVPEEGDQLRFGGSIPLDKALGSEVLLAWEMNGQALPPLHGFPLRAVVPGYIGARSVKWLGGIRVQEQPSENHFQLRSYRLFAPQIRPPDVDWDQGLMLGELSVNAGICRPAGGQTVSPGTVELEGYAVTAGPRRVARVDVSADDGRSWTSAELLGPDEPWAWRRWRAALDLEPGRVSVAVRAVDSSGNVQPEGAAPLWNFKGYVNNAWHRLDVTVGAPAGRPLGRCGARAPRLGQDLEGS